MYSFMDVLSRIYYNVGCPLICTTYSLLKFPVLQGTALWLPVLGLGSGRSWELPAWVQAMGSAWSTGPPRLPPALRRDRARKAVLVFHKPQLKPLQN